MIRTAITALALCLTTAVLGSAPSTLVIADVTVVDILGGPLQPHRDVRVDGGLITAITPHANPRAGERVLDAHGKYLIPGLWDMHAHTFNNDAILPDILLRLQLANGVTGVRDMGAAAAAPPVLFRRAIDTGAILLPRLVVAGRVIDGVPPAKPTHVAVASADDARQAVAAAQDAGVDFIKVYSNLSREAFFAIADESRKRGLTFGGHVPIAITVHEAAEAGMASIEHFWGVLLACSSREAELTAEEQKENARPPAAQFRGHFTTARAAIDSFDETKAQAIFRTFVAHGTYQVPTLEALRRFGVPHALPPGSDYMPPEIRRILMAGQGRMDPALSEAGRLYYGEVLKLVGEMRRAGVSFMAGTDSAVPGFMLHQELERFVDAGLSPLEALQTATIVPARFLHREAQTGSIAAGKTADLVLLDADPTRDIRNTTTIRSVVLRGEVFDRDALDSMLEHIKTAVAAR